MRWLTALLVAGLVLFNAATALSQSTVRPCVTTGTTTCPPVSASNPMPITGTVTAGGTQDTNITQILGAAPSATNPLWVSPATASTPWAVTGTITAVTGITNTVVTQELGASFVNITTNADTNVKGSAGTLVGFSVNTAGTTSTLKLFNDADGTCSSGLIGTFSTLAQGYVGIPAAATIGICAQTAGGAAADVTVYFR